METFIIAIENHLKQKATFIEQQVNIYKSYNKAIPIKKVFKLCE